MNTQNERERIVKELQDKFYWIPTGPCANEIATWHLAEVKRIVEPLVNHNIMLERKLGGKRETVLIRQKLYDEIISRNGIDAIEVIDETLKRVNGGE